MKMQSKNMSKKIKITENNLKKLVQFLLNEYYSVESVYQNLHEAAPQQLTVGMMRQALKDMEQADSKGLVSKSWKNLAKSGSKATAHLAASLIPGLSAAPSVAEFIEDAADVGRVYSNLAKAGKRITAKTKKHNHFWDSITIDDGKLDIMDLQVEQRFAEWVENYVNGLPDNHLLPDIDLLLGDWLKQNFDGYDIQK